MTTQSLSARQARRLALKAQGLSTNRPEAIVSERNLKALVEEIGLLQIDSVNVFARAHLMPTYSRLGAYDTGLLDRLAFNGRKRALFEYWAHEACFLPVGLYPLFRWRMARAEAGEGIYKGLVTFARERSDFVQKIEAEIEKRGPLAASDFEGGAGKGSWWGWSEAKHALEWLFWTGRVTTATRRASFERVYDLTARALPRAVVSAPQIREPDAIRELILHSARLLGVATEPDLRDYFRLDPADSKAAVASLLHDGQIERVTVEGWKDAAYLLPGTTLPRRASAVTLLSPFDPLVFERARTERLFNFRYRIEIYTPAEKRQFGYYCLPLLHGEAIVARLDLKADRQAGVLRVQSAHCEDGIEPQMIAEATRTELQRAATWLGLGSIAYGNRTALDRAIATD